MGIPKRSPIHIVFSREKEMMEAYKNIAAINAYRDGFGMITQADRDGGDTANRTGAYYIYLKYLGAEKDDRDQTPMAGLMQDMRNLEKKDGRYCRHPDPTRWYSNIDNFTRDQSIHLQGAMVLYGLKTAMWRLIKTRFTRAFFHFNTHEGDDRPETVKTKLPDPPAPVEFAQFIRGMDAWYLYPLLWVLDIQLVIDVGITRPITIKQGNKDFDSNYLPILLASDNKWPTMWSGLAKEIYKKTDAPDKLRIYFKEGEGLNGLTPLGELAVLSFEKMRKD